MKKQVFNTLGVLLGLNLAVMFTACSRSNPNSAAAATAAGPAADRQSAIDQQLSAVVDKINAKLKDGPPSESTLAPELKEIDDLFAAHKNEKTDDVAKILLVKGKLYEEAFQNYDKEIELFQQLLDDFPDTTYAKQIDQEGDIALLKKESAAAAIRRALAVGTKFPDFDLRDTDGKPLSVSNDQGKVVLLDFWATWCAPCLVELPNVLKVYDLYHDKGFEIIGVSLDETPKELETFIQDRKMTWPEFNDGKRWDNELVAKYGITGIPANYLLNRDGVIIGKDLEGDDLARAVAEALTK